VTDQGASNRAEAGGRTVIPRFSHKYAKSHYVRFKAAEWGGLQTDALVIVANIPLEPGSEGFDEAKVEELAAAVTKYVKSRHSPYASVEFIQEFPAERKGVSIASA
jgi:hypothetical protein